MGVCDGFVFLFDFMDYFLGRKIMCKVWWRNRVIMGLNILFERSEILENIVVDPH